MVWVTLPLVAVTVTTWRWWRSAFPLPPQPVSCVDSDYASDQHKGQEKRTPLLPSQEADSDRERGSLGKERVGTVWRAALLLSANVRAVDALWPVPGVTVAGLKLQVRFVGTVEQVNVVAELNPY